jgi:hypothetical protein
VQVLAPQWWSEIITTYAATEVYTVDSDGSTVASSVIYPNTTTTIFDVDALRETYDINNLVLFYTLNTMETDAS